MKYRKKPVVIDAIQWTGGNAEQVMDFVGKKDQPGERAFHHSTTASICIPTLHGPTWANRGDWVIRGTAGDYWPCKPDIFEATYDRIETIITNHPEVSA